MPVTPNGSPTASGASGLAVLIGAEASLTPADIAVSCDGLADLSFLADRGEADRNPMLWQVASRLATTTLVDFGDEDACLSAVRQAGATAVTTFAERLCPLAARLNDRLGIPSGADVPWGRKDLQRELLREAGLSRIQSSRLPGPDQLRAFARSVGYPLVVKPVDGVASRDTWLLTGSADLDAFLSREGTVEEFDGLFAEEFIAGTGSSVPWLAEYLSVEVFRSGNSDTGGSDAFITHRLPSAWPFRETGLYLPSPLPPERQQPLIDCARNALDALGVHRGSFHVEMKPAAHGPEIIEVNGRLGGYITRLARYGADGDLGRLALACALGREPDVALNWTRCALVLLFQPPPDARRVVRTPTRREVKRLDGVVAVEEIVAVGTAVHWRNGTLGRVAQLWLAADSHQELHDCLVRVTEFLTEHFEYVDDAGRPVRDLSWLETVAG